MDANTCHLVRQQEVICTCTGVAEQNTVMERRNNTLWSALPEGVKLKTLSLVSPSQQKLALRFVSRDWKALLDNTAAYKNTAPLELNRLPAYPLELLRPLQSVAVGCETEDDCQERVLAALAVAVSLTHLCVCVMDPESLVALLYLGQLRVLFLSRHTHYCFDPVKCPVLTPRLLPAIEELHLEFRSSYSLTLCGELQSFSTLRRLGLGVRCEAFGADGDLSKLCLPPNCDVALEIAYQYEDLSYEDFSSDDYIPITMRTRVTSVTLIVLPPSHQSNPQLL